MVSALSRPSRRCRTKIRRTGAARLWCAMSGPRTPDQHSAGAADVGYRWPRSAAANSARQQDVCSYVAGARGTARWPRRFAFSSSIISAHPRPRSGHRNAGHGQGMFMSEQQERLEMRASKADCRRAPRWVELVDAHGGRGPGPGSGSIADRHTPSHITARSRNDGIETTRTYAVTEDTARELRGTRDWLGGYLKLTGRDLLAWLLHTGMRSRLSRRPGCCTAQLRWLVL